jgi:hypothetical protein
MSLLKKKKKDFTEEDVLFTEVLKCFETKIAKFVKTAEALLVAVN